MYISNMDIPKRVENDPVIVPEKAENRKTSNRLGCRDPFIMLYDGKYYLYKGAYDGINCFVSEDLETWSKPVYVFNLPENFHGTDCLFWAPECHYYKGKFYIFTSVKDGELQHRTISVYRADNPLGPFEDIAGGRITPADWDSIDGTLYVDEDGQPWMVFVHEWTCMPNNTGAMAAAKLSDDLTHFISEPIQLFLAREPEWATNGVTDGPYMYRHDDGKLEMVWSNFSKRDYVVAVAQSSNGRLDGKWTHRDHLLYQKNLRPEWTTDGGHAMIFKAKDGKTKITFHGPNYRTPYDFEHLQIYDLEVVNGTIEIAQADVLRAEHPRPELVRDDWKTLNGVWEFEFDFDARGTNSGVLDKAKFDRTIRVPFCPESKASGIAYTGFIPACWYRRKFTISKGGERIILNFEASDYKTQVFVNKTKVGEHEGGYTPFSFDITGVVKNGENELAVYVESDVRNPLQPSGKQSQKAESYGCFYTRTTGIWQTVWLEKAPKTYLKSVKLDPCVKTETLTAMLTTEGRGDKVITLTAFFGGEKIATASVSTKISLATVQLKIPSPKLWSVEEPNLYDLEISVKSKSGEDKVKSYFGMRSIESDERGIRLNGKYVFGRFVLDQGYYYDCVYTAPNKEAFEQDIAFAKFLGFNGARLHQKVFERRFLYYADKRGYLVWEEFPDWGFDWSSSGALDVFLREWMEAVKRDYNHPCVIGWCPTNETWSQDADKQPTAKQIKTLYRKTKNYDPTRPIIDSSGSKHIITDVFDHHDYDQDVKSFAKKYKNFGKSYGKGYKGQRNSKHLPYFLSEYGGTSWKLKDNGWGYGDAPKSAEEFIDHYSKLSLTLLNNPKISALCYTQLYDVEQEQNGLFSFARDYKFKWDEREKLAKVLRTEAAIERIN
jgi:GH43 family beta-xylosidase